MFVLLCTICSIYRLSSAQLCQSMAELKAAPGYEESERESQQQTDMLPQTKASLEAREREVELEQRVQLLVREKEQQFQAELQSKERELAELRRLLQSQQGTPQSAAASPPQKVRTVKDLALLAKWCTLFSSLGSS